MNRAATKGTALAISGFVLALALPTFSEERVARADGDDPALAEQLFQQARTLEGEGNFKEACPKFLASQKASPAVGTLLNLGACYEKLNMYASAWGRYREAIAAAQRAGRADREKTARERAQKIEGRLSHITITAKDSPIDVRRDDVVVDEAALSTPLVVDSGSHTITAKAPGKKPWSKTFNVAEAGSETIAIPALVAIPEDDKTPPTTDGGTKEPPPDSPPPQSSGGSGLRTASYITLGLGVVGVGVGSYFGIQTFSNWSAAQPRCPKGVCDASGQSLASDAKNDGNISTAMFIVGGALVATGAVLFFISPSSSSNAPATAKTGLIVAPSIAPSFGGLSVTGRM